MIEEIARFRLEHVPFTLPLRRAMFGTLSRDQVLRRRVEDALVGLGFAEIYTPSLRPDDDTAWRLPEPISVELTALRTTLLPSLIEADAPQHRCRRAPDRALRDRTGVSRRRRSAGGAPPGGRGRRGRLPRGQGSRRVALRRPQGRAGLQPRGAPALPSREDGVDPGRRARRAASARARRRVGRVRARPARAVRGRARAGRVPGRDHVSGRPAGHRRGGRRGGCRSATWSPPRGRPSARSYGR